MSSESSVVLASSQAPIPQEVAKPVKEKKPRTEAQQAATQKALAAMTAKRKEQIEKKKEVKEKVKIAKKVVEDKILKEDLGFVTRQDFESMRKELSDLRALHEATRMMKAQESKPKPTPERIVERVIERVPTPSAQPQKLSGHALLDSIFFNKGAL